EPLVTLYRHDLGPDTAVRTRLRLGRVWVHERVERHVMYDCAPSLADRLAVRTRVRAVGSPETGLDDEAALLQLGLHEVDDLAIGQGTRHTLFESRDRVSGHVVRLRKMPLALPVVRGLRRRTPGE